MKRIAIALGLVMLAAPGFAGPMEEVCLARGTWDGATCTCIQGVADETLEPDTQELAAAYFSQQITSQQSAVQYGVSVAEAFLTGMATFLQASTAKCGAPRRRRRF